LDAFETIAAGETDCELDGGVRVYRFEGFGLTLPK
jgi:hypothetical protein